ncbi:radical SAM protein [Limnobacter parvus]|uniref:Radical SAM protein n=1 Tax=Limnobacter parvus TaxID=2939690 RepID=A0ABT1XHX2_9BURK|nr:radical SAM protein [Limnobacter parvus]MCR2746893.1 radical SAM protein [Limnobacter parvus]
MNHDDIERIRRMPGSSLLLFITDRCPVNCAHCSVDSRSDGPVISDYDLFDALLTGICQQEKIEVVGISGGEPFAERRGLTLACSKFNECGKSIVIYTSGVWAKASKPPGWITDVLKKCSTIYLSTDSFHQAGVPVQHFTHAACQIADAGAHIVVQTLDVKQASDILHKAFKTDFTSFAEIVPIVPLQNGRGKQIFNFRPATPAASVGSCALAITPVVRYDGIVTSCCNEEIIMGHGPQRFRSKARSSDDLDEILVRYKHDPLMRCVAGVGLGQLLIHPRLDSLNKQKYVSTCQLCWEIMKKFPALPPTDRLIHAIAELGEADEHHIHST